jgi:hypothetical protein
MKSFFLIAFGVSLGLLYASMTALGKHRLTQPSPKSTPLVGTPSGNG